MIKLSDYVIDYIRRLNVKTIFLLPGGGCMHLVDSLGKNKKLKYVCCLHEQAAAIAADAYSQYSGNLGVALVTTGPGGTNTITAVAGAWIDSIPLLIISGQAKRADMIRDSKVRQMGTQEVNIVSVVGPITKYAVTVFNPADIKYHLEKALYLAKTGRPGPVWLDIPLDVQGAMINENRLKGFRPKNASNAKSDKDLKTLASKCIKLLNRSERPVILAGNGVRLSGALDDFKSLIKILKAPVLTTWKAVDFLPEDHGLYFGRPGSIGQRGANFIQQNSDFVMTLGARLDLGQTGFNHKNFAPLANKVIVDIDPFEIRKLKMDIDMPVCLDAKVFIRGLIREKNKIKPIDRKAWLKRCSVWKKRYPVVLPGYFNKRRYVNTYVLVDLLSRLMRGADIFIPGSSGACSEIAMQAFKVKKGQRIFNSPGLGSMGFGLPASIGACLASGRKRTISIIGDGGLQHNIQELETLRRLKLPVKLFILNNEGYGSIRNTQKSHFKANYVCCGPSSGLTFPDISKIAFAYGIKYYKISRHKGLKKKLQDALHKEGPVICEIMTDPSFETAPRLSSQVLPDGSIISKPLEDLYPFLDRREFNENMIARRA